MAKTGSPVPRTIEQLRELVIAIGRGDAAVSLGGKAHAVLAKLVDRPNDVAVRTITELSDSFGVNPSTLTRLTTRLGYAGFADFQSVFRNNVTESSRKFYTQQAHRLIDDAAKSEPTTEIGVVMKLAQESIRNIDGFLSQLNTKDLTGAARLLARARRVRAYGLRQIHSLSSYLTYGLGMMRADVSLLDGPGLGVAEGLAQMEKGDVLVVSSVAPYTRMVVDVARAAEQAGIAVIALTDTRASPLVPPARHAFFIPHESSFISNSMGAYVVFCEGLLNLVARELGDHALQALERREGFINELNIETD
ncbi:MurR/RpiR family transcriptional regulator [Noviherbaspirillum saxi]|uniref:MurR/RpiR family transcriptional regulator n=1 Tax=Noviherbaspirillum saxi TaxID=2320863 RepID=A0A3A3FNM9_9BURK|nr:MurR/RpiR family transcriptional regulator [Noviherbaspirillum saxi]RJF95052.1 MurR/RpiR family transcriptional regulator [Noviherbaspirillum saxi]